jgi:hypothetical protein
MKLLFTKSNTGDRLNYKWLFISLFFLTSHFFILQIDRKVSLAEDIRLSNVDHDIDDLIDTPKRKFTPTSDRSNLRREADPPKDRRQPQPNNSEVERNREQNRRRK